MSLPSCAARARNSGASTITGSLGISIGLAAVSYGHIYEFARDAGACTWEVAIIAGIVDGLIVMAVGAIAHARRTGHAPPPAVKGTLIVGLPATTGANVHHGLGYKPELAVGDGAHPPPDGPADRLVSTVTVRNILRRGWRLSGRATSSSPRGHPAPASPSRVCCACSSNTTRRPDASSATPRSWSPATTATPAWLRTASSTSPTRRRAMSDRTPAWDVVLGHQVPGLGYASYEVSDDSGEATVMVFDRSGSGPWALGEYTPTVRTTRPGHADPVTWGPGSFRGRSNA